MVGLSGSRPDGLSAARPESFAELEAVLPEIGNQKPPAPAAVRNATATGRVRHRGTAGVRPGGGGRG